MSEGNVFRLPPGGGNGTVGAGGGDGGGIHIDLITPYIDAKMGQLRVELGAELDGKLSGITSQLSGLPKTATIWRAVGTLALVIVGSIGAIFAILAYTGDRVDGGVAAAAAYNAEIVSARERDAQQTRSLVEINNKLDQLSSEEMRKP